LSKPGRHTPTFILPNTVKPALNNYILTTGA
jgi:hypothetical protein